MFSNSLQQLVLHESIQARTFYTLIGFFSFSLLTIGFVLGTERGSLFLP